MTSTPSSRRAVNLRRRLATEVDDSIRSAPPHQTPPARANCQETVAPLRRIADGVIAAGLALGGKPGKALDDAYENLRIAVADAFPRRG